MKVPGMQINHKFLNLSSLEFIEWEAEREAIEDFSNGTAMIRVPHNRNQRERNFWNTFSLDTTTIQ